MHAVHRRELHATASLFKRVVVTILPGHPKHCIAFLYLGGALCCNTDCASRLLAHELNRDHRLSVERERGKVDEQRRARAQERQSTVVDGVVHYKAQGQRRAVVSVRLTACTAPCRERVERYIRKIVTRPQLAPPRNRARRSVRSRAKKADQTSGEIRVRQNVQSSSGTSALQHRAGRAELACKPTHCEKLGMTHIMSVTRAKGRPSRALHSASLFACRTQGTCLTRDAPTHCGQPQPVRASLDARPGASWQASAAGRTAEVASKGA